MPDRVVYPVLILVAGAMVALALVWPQGLGARSPGPFGHPVRPVAAAAPSDTQPGSLIGLTPPPQPTQPASAAAP